MRFTADLRPLRVKPYRRLWASTVVTTVGAQLTAVAVPLQIYEITGSSAWVGLAGLVGLGPLVLASAVNLRRCFRARLGTTPGAYRRAFRDP
ncbi:hypothetical protein ND747_23135 [Frankia sp. R82]|nr:hypothetical protein [Frankia sp. R82]MCM3886514.1 hypothetical protein [Frankia sp. R82]